MAIGVFFSYPQPHMENQKRFIDELCNYLRSRSLEPKTLGVTDYDMDAPLKAIRRLMFESNGLITVAFRRLYIERGTLRKGADTVAAQKSVAAVKGEWITSPYCHIEPAMAFQLGLPVLIFRENGVRAEGILEKGVLGTYMAEFSVDENPSLYLSSEESKALIQQWEGRVRRVVESKGEPSDARWLHT